MEQALEVLLLLHPYIETTFIRLKIMSLQGVRSNNNNKNKTKQNKQETH